MGRVDDPLVQVVGPRVGTGGAEGQAHAADELEQARPALALPGHRLGEALRAAGADLDLGRDQLAGRRLGQQVVLLTGGVDLLEAVLQLQRGRVEDRELLLESDREIGGGLESLADEVEV